MMFYILTIFDEQIYNFKVLSLQKRKRKTINVKTKIIFLHHVVANVFFFLNQISRQTNEIQV